MISRTPRKPEGGAGGNFFQWVWEKLANELRFNDSPTVKWSLTTRGISARAIIPPSQPSEPTTNFFYGDYDLAAIPAQKMVLYTPSGGAAGTYVSIQAVPAGITPDTLSPYWVKLPYESPGAYSF